MEGRVGSDINACRKFLTLFSAKITEKKSFKTEHKKVLTLYSKDTLLPLNFSSSEQILSGLISCLLCIKVNLYYPRDQQAFVP